MALDKNLKNKELLIRWLGEVIHREVSKLDDEADMELVEECEETLRLLSNSASYSEEELDEKVKNIFSGDKGQLVLRHKSHRFLIRRIAVIVACVVMVLFGSVMTAYAFVPSFQSYIKQVIGLQEGSTINTEGITFQYAGKSKEYATLEELIKAEQLGGILFPSRLTGETQISAIYLVRSDDQTHISISFDVDGLSMNILNDNGIDMSELSVTSEKKEINGIVSYISDADGVWTSVTVFDGYVYYISADAREKIITILESMF